MKLAQPTVKLAPGEIKRVPFTVHVPASHVEAGPVGRRHRRRDEPRRRSRSARSSKAGVQINIRNQTIIAVQVERARPAQRRLHDRRRQDRRPARLPAVDRPLSRTPATSCASRPARAEVLKSGQVIQTLPFEMDTFLPQTSIDYPILLKKALLPGRVPGARHADLPGRAGAAEDDHGDADVQRLEDDVKQVFTSAAPPSSRPRAADSRRPPRAARCRGRGSSAAASRAPAPAARTAAAAARRRRRRRRADRRDAGAAAGDPDDACARRARREPPPRRRRRRPSSTPAPAPAPAAWTAARTEVAAASVTW